MRTPEKSDQAQDWLQQGKWVQAMAFAIVKDHQMAEDIRQDVLVQALEGRWQGIRVRRAWLRAMSRNRALNVLRSQKRAQRREAERIGPVPTKSAIEVAEEIEAQRLLLKQVALLPESDRKLIYARFYQDLSFQEIARELNISVASARVQLHRALGNLRARLQRSCDPWRDLCGLAMGIGGALQVAGPVLASKHVAALVLVVLSAWGWILWSPFSESNPFNDDPGATTAEEAVAPVLPDPPGGANGRQQRTALPGLVAGGSEFVKNYLEDLESIQGRILWRGNGVPRAELEFVQEGKRWFSMAGEDGRFEAHFDPSVDFVIRAQKDGLLGIGNSWKQPVLIELREASTFPEPSLLVFEKGTKKPIPGASVRITLPHTQSGIALVPEEGNELLLLEGQTDGKGRCPVPVVSWSRLAVFELRAPGFQSYVGSSYSQSREDGHLFGLEPELEASIRVVDPSGNGISRAQVWLGQGMKKSYLTDDSGLIPKADWIQRRRARRGGSPLSCQNVLVATPSGRYWIPGHGGLLDKNGKSWSATEDRLILEVDDQPVEVELVSSALPQGVGIQIARIPKEMGLGDGILKAMGKIGLGGGIQFSWHPIDPGASVSIDDGCAGEESWVIARTVPGNIVVASAPVTHGRVTLEVNLAPIELCVEGLPEWTDDPWFLKFNPDYDSDGLHPSDLEFRVQEDVVRAWIPQGKYEVSLITRSGRSEISVAPNLQCFHFEGASFGIDEVGLQGKLRLPQSKLQRVQILMEGIPVLAGRINGHTLDIDGAVPLPSQNGASARVFFPELVPSGEVLRQPGGPIAVAKFLPRGQGSILSTVPLSSGDPLRWNIQLARVELDLSGLELDDQDIVAIRSLPLSIPSEDSDFVEDFAWQGILSIGEESVLNPPQTLRVGSASGVLPLRLPVGRHAIRIEGVMYTPPEGMVFDGGQIHRLVPFQD